MALKAGTTPGPSNHARYMFLESAAPKSKARHILGSVIPKSYEKRPFESYRPNWRDKDLAPMIAPSDGSIDKIENPERKKLELVMDSIWVDAEPVELTDVLAGKKLAVSTDVKASFTALLNGYIEKEHTEEVEIKSGQVKLHKFDNPGQNIHDILLECGPWESQVTKLINYDKEKKGYYLIVGVATFADVTISWDKDKQHGKGGEAKIPGEVLNAATHGAPAIQGKVARNLDVGGDWEHIKTEGSTVFAKCKQEVIFAVAYSELEVDLVEDETAEEQPSTPSKPPGFWSRIFQKPRPGKKTQIAPGAPASSSPKAPQRPKQKIVGLSVGMPIYGHGLNAAFGSESGHSPSREGPQDVQDSPGGEHLAVPSPAEDAFYIVEEDYIDNDADTHANSGVNGTVR